MAFDIRQFLLNALSGHVTNFDVGDIIAGEKLGEYAIMLTFVTNNTATPCSVWVGWSSSDEVLAFQFGVSMLDGTTVDSSRVLRLANDHNKEGGYVSKILVERISNTLIVAGGTIMPLPVGQNPALAEQLLRKWFNRFLAELGTFQRTLEKSFPTSPATTQ